MAAKAYRIYVLVLLMVIYAINFLDRQVVTIIAPYLKEDMGVSDAQIGLLFGTAFALFYAVFGLPLAKLADGWSRVRTISIGLFFWSSMTALSGFTATFGQLGAARIGVGVGEASASPASYSLLQDYFPKSVRATVLALYSSGIYIGSGASLIFGAEVIRYWSAHYTAETAPLGLSGWQATYIAFGLPGILLALLMWFTVKEPVRGAIDGLPTPGAPNPVKAVLGEFAAMLPPWNWRGFTQREPGGRAIALNLGLLAVLIVATTFVVGATDALLRPEKRAIVGHIAGLAVTTNMVQWVALATGLYCVGSWIQTIRQRDPVSYALIANRGFIGLTLAGGLMSYISYGLSPFIFLYAKGAFGIGPEGGLTLGLLTAMCGGLGASFGGIAGDWLRRYHPGGRMIVMLVAALGSAATIIATYTATSPFAFYVWSGLNMFVHIMWLGPCAASVQDLVLPRMRGTATAVFFLGTTILGLGLGPYIVGLTSDVTGDLRSSLMGTLAVMPIILGAIFVALRTVPALEASLLDRARALGEKV
ncbi:MAG: spinster family MFS transporter [Chakrabartia sp.]